MAISIPNAEEIAVKLNIDVSDAKKMQDALRGAGEHGHKSFLHADSAAKGFKKTLHELSDQVPLLGYGLRAIISPIGGAFAIAAAGISYATKALEEFNKKLDETGKANAMGSGATKESFWSGFYRAKENKEKFAADTKDGKQAFGPEQSEKIFQGKKHADEAAKVIGDAIKHNEEHPAGDGDGVIDAVSGLGIVNSLKMMFGIMPNAKDLAKRGNALGVDPNVNLQKALKSRVEDAKILLDHAEPINSNASNPLSMLSGLGLGTIFSGVRGVSQIAQLRSTVDAVRGTMPTIDNATGGYGYKGLEYHGLDYKPISGAIGSASWKLGHPDAAANSQAAAMDQILELAKSGGFNVTIKDVTVQ